MKTHSAEVKEPPTVAILCKKASQVFGVYSSSIIDQLANAEHITLIL